MGQKQAPKTSMVIKEVIEDESGDLIINVVATRSRRKYRLPYRIAARSVPQFDLEMLKIKVVQDVNDRENANSQKQAVVDKLNLQIGAKLPLD